MSTTLHAEIARYAGRGFRVESQTETSASLVKPKKFSLLAFFLLFGIFYLPFYIAKHDETVYLYTDGDGTLRRGGGKWTLRRFFGDKIRGVK